MSTPDFGELVGRIRGPLTSLGSTLPREEASEVDELLAHAELGEALRSLAWLIVEEDKPVVMADLYDLESLATQMGMTDELPVTFSRHGVGDG